ncbi:hypothetical protein [Anaeromyxobacter paludicola]|uniref:DUF885 domain-containing protein n=1 Tax=Anaeromyxobacter paludicola TaxID=2918171 RepID=A0ABN6NDI5_9BACT|nr:hypothetical protein [Anaeromyxobacter paludicola]BDG10338.1 hypothetical protein AMPC_34510 [Anaeromyxobacter paludicola]
MRTPALLAAPLALALACAHATPPPAAPAPAAPGAAPAAGAPAPSPLAPVRDEVDRLLHDEADAIWKGWTTGAPIDLDAVHARHARLFTPETLAAVRAARAGAAGAELQALDALARYLQGELLARATAAESERAAAAAAAATVTWDGRKVAASRVPALLAAEPDPSRRAALEHLAAEAARARAPLAQAWASAVRDQAGRLGYPDARALVADLRGAPPERLAALAEDALSATDKLYRMLLADLAGRELKLPLDRLRERDLRRLFRTARDARTFPAPRVLGHVSALMDGLGFAVGQQKNLTVDDRTDARKDPRPLVMPVDVPGDVRVSFVPQGGAPELRGVLHELATAQFLAHVQTPVMEFRRLPPPALTEAYGTLFEWLTADPTWLVERAQLPLGHRDLAVRTELCDRLHAVRGLAARVLVEAARLKDPAGAEAAARRFGERAFAHPVEADEAALFLVDQDPLLASAEELRGALLGAQLEAYLSRRAVDAPWWRSREAGGWLLDRWSVGGRLTPDELARLTGSRALDAAGLAGLVRARAEAAGLRL